VRSLILKYGKQFLFEILAKSSCLKYKEKVIVQRKPGKKFMFKRQEKVLVQILKKVLV